MQPKCVCRKFWILAQDQNRMVLRLNENKDFSYVEAQRILGLVRFRLKRV
jgi:hypothetical protein